MRSLGLWAGVAAATLAGCAPALIGPRAVTERIDPAPYAAALATYNLGPKSARVAGKLKAAGKGSADFGGAVVTGKGLRLDAVAGPFGTAVFALACGQAEGCRAYVPSRRTLYVLKEGLWGELFEKLLLGRVPVVGEIAGAWSSTDASPVLLFRGLEGWEERVEMSKGSLLPDRLFFGRQGEEPLIRVTYADYGPSVDGHPFPRRIEIALRTPPQDYEIAMRRIEPATNIDTSTFGLSPPPGTREESVGGKATWNETGIPLWPPSPNSPKQQ